ncbi:uncharacterized protein [Macrobrachium rosenbergii]|uniref:uncharacterized protein isoform X2 n=1 Tax=Macrobrachium rosenbergii TaxID=79674 RepID=UPI0034D3DA55
MRVGVRRAPTIFLALWGLLSLERCALGKERIPSGSALMQSTLSDSEANLSTIFGYDFLQGDSPQRKRRQVDEGILCPDPGTPINAVVNITSEGRSAVVRCLEHHRNKLNMTSFRVGCINGGWQVLDLPEGITEENLNCSPFCDPPCVLGECLVKGDETGTFCKCPEMHFGKTCEIEGCKSFPVVTKIVLEWNELQQDGDEDVGPAIIKTSEVKGKCYKGTFFKMADYGKTAGPLPMFNEFTFKCDQGRWKVRMADSDTYMEFDKAECEYICDPLCLNGGSCVLTTDGVRSCKCMPGFGGDHCELKTCDYDVILEDYTWEEPHPSTNQYTGHIWKECPEEYIHSSTGNRSYIETCENGEWIKPEGSCEPVCSPPCLNDGLCIRPNLCACPIEFAGSYCQLHSCLNAWSPIIGNAEYKTEVQQLRVSCKNGYNFPSGNSTMVFDCVEGSWDFETKKAQPCVPNCISTPCKNGGTCIFPSTCKCPEEFTGRRCEKEKCLLPPKFLHNAFGNFSNRDQTIFKIECSKGYELITHETSLTVKCEGGVWQFPKGLQDVQSISCRPVCAKPCFNGGRCVRPGECRCPEGFTGPQCTKRYEDTVEEGVKCVFPFMYKRVWYYSCTTFGYHMPWCATQVSSTGAMTKWAACFADTPWTRVRLTVTGQLCWFPFRFNQQLHYDCTSEEATEPWCASSVDENKEVTQRETCSQLDIETSDVILTSDGEKCSSKYLPGGELHQEMISDGDSFGVCHTESGVSQPSAIETSLTAKQPAKTVLIDSGYRKNEVTRTGRKCQLPFTFGGLKYYGCVVTAYRRPWCLAEATDINGAGILKSEECAEPFHLGKGIRELTLTNVLPNSSVSDEGNPIGSVRSLTSLSGRRCVFPFKYLGETHYGCVYKGAANPWCATNIDTEGNAVTREACPKDWDPSSFGERMVGLYAANKNKSMSTSGLPCVPFNQDGQLVQGCVKEKGQLPWCTVAVNSKKEATATDFCVPVEEYEPQLAPGSEFLDYVNMLVTNGYNFLEPSRRQDEYVLYSVNGSRCQPFSHDDKMQHGCIEEEGKHPWCAVSVDDDELPTDVGSCPYSWKFWRYFLSTDPNFWSPYLGGLDITLTESGQQCVFPFMHEGEMYRQCVESDDRPPWCATAINRDGLVLQKDVCQERPAVIKSASGKICLPFLHEGILQEGCVKPKDDRDWCAVRVDDLGLLLEKDFCTPNWNTTKMDVPPPESSNTTGGVVSLETTEGKRCVPFVHNGVIVKYCAENEEKNESWCATSTDDKGLPIETGTCPKDWRDVVWPPGTELKNETILPGDDAPCIRFKHDGKLVTGCVTAPPAAPFCAIETDENMEPTKTKTCPPDWQDDSIVHGDNDTAATDEVTGGNVVVSVTEGLQEGVSNSTLDSFQTLPSEEEEEEFVVITKPTEGIALQESSFTLSIITSGVAAVETRSSLSSTATSMLGTSTTTLRAAGTTPKPITSSAGELTTIEGLLCVFPFRYNGQLHDNCTSVDAEAPWCPTRVNRRLRPIVTGYCSGYGEMPREPSPKIPPVTVDNHLCQFPFVWKNVTYHRCTKAERSSPWCATQLDEMNRPLASGYCFDSLVGPIPSKPAPTVYKGRGLVKNPCVFPFVYKGKTYTNCTQKDSIVSWCAYEVDSFRHPTRVGCCSGSGEPAKLKVKPGHHEFDVVSQMTDDGEECIFPFLHNGKWHYTCIWTPGTERPWCVTLVDPFGRTVSSGYCLSGPQNRLVSGGASSGFYRPSGGPQDRNRQGGGTSPAEAGVDDQPYESESQDYIPIGYQPISTTRGKKCIFPFWYAGRWYSNCTNTDHHKPWCAIAVNAKGGVISADYCILGSSPATTTPPTGSSPVKDTRPKGPVTAQNVTENGIKCVLPFVYGGKKFCQCTWEGDTRPWCATSVDLDRHVVTRGYCRVKALGEQVDKDERPGERPGGDGDGAEKESLDTEDLQWDVTPSTTTTTPAGSSGQTDKPSTTTVAEYRPSEMTVSGKKCIFPFIYKGIRYEHCACMDAPACWCATNVTLDLQPATSEYCRDYIFGPLPAVPSPAFGEGAVLTVDGCTCSLPFVYKGETYTHCTTKDSTYPWCPTLVNEQRNPITTAYCRNDDYGAAPKHPPPSSETGQGSPIEKRSVDQLEGQNYNDPWLPKWMWANLPNLTSLWS